jgi:lipopolysaccharide transport system permease protein
MTNLLKTGWSTELWQYRELLYFFAWRDVKVRYKQAALGVAWAIMQPLLTMLVFTLFFGRLAKVPSDGIPYPLFSYCALVPWMYFAGVIAQSGNSLVLNASLITKVYFPRVLLPASGTVSGLLDLAVSSAMLVALMVYYHVKPTWAILLLPIPVLALVSFTLAVSLLLAAVNVKYRDVKYIIPFMTQVWMFVTPVIYPTSLVPAQYRSLLALNPMWGVIDAFRACVLPGRSVDPGMLVVSGVVIVSSLIVAALYFHKSEELFADII